MSGVDNALATVFQSALALHLFALLLMQQAQQLKTTTAIASPWAITALLELCVIGIPVLGLAIFVFAILSMLWEVGTC